LAVNWEILQRRSSITVARSGSSTAPAVFDKRPCSASGCSDNFASANWGVIVATGDLNLQNFTFNGFIYTAGNVYSHGHVLVRGGIFSSQGSHNQIDTLGTLQFCGGTAVLPLTLSAMIYTIVFPAPLALLLSFCLALVTVLSLGNGTEQLLILMGGLAPAALMPRGVYFQAAQRWPHMFLTLSPTYMGLAQAAYDFTMAYLRGEPKVWSVVRVPSVAEEDARRLNRERDRLVSERVQHVNRIKGLCATQGIYDYQPQSSDRLERLEKLRTGDGRALPTRLKAEIVRELQAAGRWRLAMVWSMIWLQRPTSSGWQSARTSS